MSDDCETPDADLLIRPARPNDATAVAAIYAPIVRQTAISFEFTAPDADEMRRRIERRLDTYPFLVAELGGLIVGYATASEYRSRPAYQWSAESSVYVAPDAHRRGVARRLYERLFEHLDRQNIRVVVAGIALPNEASVRFHESVGFVHAGTMRAIGHKLGSDRDLGFWTKTLDAAPAPRGPFIPWARIAAPSRADEGRTS